MKIMLLLFVVCLCIGSRMMAQDKRLIVSGNDEISGSIPDSIKYLYPGFVYGKVYYKDGNSGGSMLNYNLLAGAVQFINQTNDTLSLANENTLKMITIGKDTFYYDNMYTRLVAGNTVAKLAKSERISLSDIKKGAAFDSYTSSGGVDNVSSLNVGSQTVHLTDKKQMIFVVHKIWYVGDAYNHFLPATKKNILKMFGKKGNLNTYITEHNIDFSKESDLRTLVEFANNP